MATIVGIFAIALPILTAFHLVRQQSVDEQLNLASLLARDALRRSDQIVAQLEAALDELAAAGLEDPCSREGILRMSAISISSSYLSAIGNVEGNRVMCASVGTIPVEGIDIGPLSYQGGRNTSVRVGVRFDAVPGVAFLLINDNASRVGA